MMISTTYFYRKVHQEEGIGEFCQQNDLNRLKTIKTDRKSSNRSLSSKGIDKKYIFRFEIRVQQ